MGFARVHRVPMITEGGVRAPPQRPAFSWAPREADARDGKAAATPDEAMLFDLEGFEAQESSAVVDAVSESAARTRAAVAQLVQPSDADRAVHLAATTAVQASGGSLEAAAEVLARLGYNVRLNRSAGGTLRSLRHAYLTATRNAPEAGEPAEWVIDPSFGQAFAVTHPTPRYAHILAAVPPLLVAPLRRVVRAVLLLGAELARCFEKQGVPLPPWRHADALATRYDAVASLPVRAGSGKAPAPAPEAQATARKQQRERQQLQLVRLRLARLGVVPDATAPAASPASSAASPSGEAGLDSPLSVLPEASLQRGASSRIVGFDAKADECFCGGWRVSPFCPPQRQQRQRLRGAAGLLDGRPRHCGYAASAA